MDVLWLRAPARGPAGAGSASLGRITSGLTTIRILEKKGHVGRKGWPCARLRTRDRTPGGYASNSASSRPLLPQLSTRHSLNIWQDEELDADQLNVARWTGAMRNDRPGPAIPGATLHRKPADTVAEGVVRGPGGGAASPHQPAELRPVFPLGFRRF